MALSANTPSLKLPLKPPHHHHHPSPSQLLPQSRRPRFKSLSLRNPPPSRSSRAGVLAVRRAVEESQGEQTTESEQLNQADGGQEDKSSDLGAEIQKAMMERKKQENPDGGDLLSGVAEEVREIEWPSFGKVLGTTGVVLGVIAGSSVVLLTVNALLAELSDKAFAGRGVQDFFS